MFTRLFGQPELGNLEDLDTVAIMNSDVAGHKFLPPSKPPSRVCQHSLMKT